ncbi:MAG: glycerol-3-phosphate 1-O-acyltransferase PlsY [Nitrospiraceae bacterium]|nr:glycerol-3-phosphate 1-O-acyltransferase PlsY [Nitrospiraceae bacterium]
MSDGLRLFLVIAAGYLMGSLPFGVLISRARGIDIKSVGSGNIGATNVLRGVGKKAAVFTLLGDALKGSAAVAAARLLGLGALGQGLAGISAVLGHNFSVFLGFRGGKGVATGLGVMFAYVPLTGLIAVASWLLAAFMTRYSSLSALLAFMLAPVVTLIIEPDKTPGYLLFAVAGLILWSHTGNIKRLIAGKERRIGEKA